MRIGILACSVFEPELEKVLKDIKAKQLFEDNIEEHLKDDFIVGLDVANGATYKVAEEVFKKLPRLCVGYMNRQSMQQNMQAITFDDIMFKKSLWEKIKNGISKSKSLQRDVEICTKIRGNDLLLVY